MICHDLVFALVSGSYCIQFKLFAPNAAAGSITNSKWHYPELIWFLGNGKNGLALSWFQLYLPISSTQIQEARITGNNDVSENVFDVRQWATGFIVPKCSGHIEVECC